MAPTTRAGSKRRLGGTESQPGPNPQRKTPKAVREAVRKAEQHFPFLELSPELRNRIYDYASEDLNDHRIAPRLTYSLSLVKPYESRLWKFFALTQICKLIREEYRPLWMRRLSARLHIHQLGRFVETFQSTVSQRKHSPRLIQITWEHGMDSLGWTDITSLLLLRAHCPQFRCEFIPSNIACGLAYEDIICLYCMESFRLDDLGMDLDENPWEECTCPPPNLNDDEWESYEYDQIDYTDGVRSLVHNATDAWLDDVRKGKVRVRCRFATPDNCVTFRFLYAEQVCDDTNNIKSAWELLNSWGLFGLAGLANAEFILAYENKQKSEEGGYDVVHSVVRDVHFTKTEIGRHS